MQCWWHAQVTSHLGPEQLPNALYNSHLVIIPAGVPRKPGMTRDDLFNINAGKDTAVCVILHRAFCVASLLMLGKDTLLPACYNNAMHAGDIQIWPCVLIW